MSIFQNSFRLIANVQTTYVFQLSKALNAQEIEKHFPDCPTDFSAKDFHRIFENVEIQNSHRSDLFALVAARLQHVAALAYIGEKEAAREILSKLASQPFTKREPFIRWITQSTHNPTYFPDGTPIILD